MIISYLITYGSGFTKEVATFVEIKPTIKKLEEISLITTRVEKITREDITDQVIKPYKQP